MGIIKALATPNTARLRTSMVQLLSSLKPYGVRNSYHAPTHRLPITPQMDLLRTTPTAELVADAEHFQRVVQRGILPATASLDIMAADFKAMLVPDGLG